MGTIFLDLDGTLCDSARPITEAIAHALQEMRIAPPPLAELRRFVGPPLVESFAALGVADPQTALAHYRAHYTGGAMLSAPLYPGVFEALAALKAAGHQLYLMTAKPRVYAVQITAYLGLAPYLRGQYGPELDGRFNDKGALLAHAMRELGADPGRTVMVGDRGQDMRAGRQNGTFVIAATWGYGSAEEWAGADATPAMPADLPSAIAALI